MAVTNIHSIKTNLSGAISYIIDPDKTVNGLYVTSYLCRDDSRGAAEDFAKARQRGTGRTKILAHHIIQSFKPDEITPEQALTVSEELCDRFLKGRYQYVLAIHTDHDHIHAHIIFNNVNAYNGLSFTYEENQGKVKERSWAKLRAVSDEICQAHGLSVIDEPEKKAVSHFERDMQKEGKSWKDKLRVRIAEIMMYSKSLDEFFKNCTESGIEYVYKPSIKHKLKFRMQGQERFTRAETLGEEYTAERIVEQIEAIKKVNQAKQRIAEMSKPKTPEVKPLERTFTPTPPIPEVKPSAPTQHVTEVKPTAPIPESKPTEKKNIEVDTWATIRGMRGADEIIRELESSGISTFSEFSSFFYNTPHADDHTKVLSNLNDRILEIDELIGKMKHLAELSPTYKEYKSKSGWSQSRFKKKNASVIEDYEETFAYIKEHRQPFLIDGKLPSINKLTDMLNDLKIQFNELVPEHNKFIAKRNAADKYKRQVKNYLNEQHNKRESEMSRQRKLGRNKTYLE